MRTAQLGDRVQIHYVKRLQHGAVASSRAGDKQPIEVVIGTDHPRLPGLGLGLVGLTPGKRVTLSVPAEQAYGIHDPSRIRRLATTRFASLAKMPIGKRVRIKDGRGREHLVRVLEVSDKVVVVDANHRWAGQSLELDVELIAIATPGAALE